MCRKPGGLGNDMKPRHRFYGQCFLFSTLLLGLPCHVWAEDSNVNRDIIQLAPLIQEALQNNPEMVAAHAQVAAMRERIPQSNALDDPEFTIRLWNTPNSLNVTRSDRAIYGLAQQFPFPGTLSQQEHIAEKTFEQAEQRLAGKEREISAKVKVAYFELFYAHQAIDIHHKQSSRLQQFFQSATAKFRVAGCRPGRRRTSAPGVASFPGIPPVLFLCAGRGPRVYLDSRSSERWLAISRKICRRVSASGA